MAATLSRLALILALLAQTAAAAAASAAEARRIEHLIRSVEQLADAKFVRNGTAYDASAAAAHLRLKLREAGNRVASAEDFIRLCGSRSSVSGEPYHIVFGNGSRVTSEAFLRAKLKELEASATPKG